MSVFIISAFTCAALLAYCVYIVADEAEMRAEDERNAHTDVELDKSDDV